MPAFRSLTLYYMASLSLVFPPIFAASCNQDNCLRAFENRVNAASSFCSAYTAVPTYTSSLPAYVASCSYSASRISSAYACLAGSTTSTCGTPVLPTVINRGFESGFESGQISPWNANVYIEIGPGGDSSTIDGVPHSGNYFLCAFLLPSCNNSFSIFPEDCNFS